MNTTQGSPDDFVPAADQVAGVQRWMALDLWTALGLDSADFEGYYDRNGFGTTWAVLGGRVRDLTQGAPECAVNSWCLLRGGHLGPCLDGTDVGHVEPLPAAASGVL